MRETEGIQWDQNMKKQEMKNVQRWEEGETEEKGKRKKGEREIWLTQ